MNIKQVVEQSIYMTVVVFFSVLIFSALVISLYTMFGN